MRQWEIAHGGRTCSGCERLFERGDPCWSALYEGMDVGEYARRDYCAACQDRVDVGRPYSVWRTTGRPPARLPRTPIDAEMALGLLERLCAPGADPVQERLAYLLALLLMRRKVLRFAGVRNGELRVRRKGVRRTWRLREVALTAEEVAGMESEIDTLLALDQASAPAPVPTAVVGAEDA